MEYNSAVDYYDLVMSFAKENPSYAKEVWSGNHSCYLEHICYMDDFTFHPSFISRKFSKDFRNNFWWKWFVSDVKQQAASRVAFTCAKNAILNSLDIKDSYLFITVNFDDSSNITAKKMLDIAQKLCKLRYFVSGKYVLEKFREQEGIHHHIHFLVKTSTREKVSDICKAIYKPKYVKDYVKGIQFIDIKNPYAANASKRAQAYDVYDKYVSGDKQSSKLPYVAKDRKWRDENFIEHLYEFLNV